MERMEKPRVRRLAGTALLWIAPVLGLATLGALDPSQMLWGLFAAGVALVGLLVAVGALIWLPFERRNPRAGDFFTPVQVFAVGAAAFCVHPLMIGIKKGFEYRTRCWLESFAPQIDAHIAQVGAPPESFAAIDAPSLAAPYLARIGRVHYWEEDGGYGFRISTGWFSDWVWNSTDRTWRHYN
jgi:hypothetical protein